MNIISRNCSLQIFIVFSPCSTKNFILTGNILTRLKTENSQNSRSCGVPSLDTSTPLFNVLLPLALVPVLVLSSLLPRLVVTCQRSSPGALDRHSPQLFWKEYHSLAAQKTFTCWKKCSRKKTNFTSTRNSLLSSSKPS